MFVMRAITIPVAGPIDKDWASLRKALTESWSDATRLANWAVIELAKADEVRLPSDTKLPKFTPPYLYPGARLLVPHLATHSVVALLNSVIRKYQAERYERVWCGSRSLPSYRYPMPLPFPSQAVSVEWLSETERVPVMHVNIAGTRMSLRLRGGAEFRRQLALFAQLVDGSGRLCEGAFMRQPVSENANRPSIQVRAPGGGGKQHHRIMAKLVGWFPRQERQASGLIIARTTATSLWRVDLETGEPWLYHADHIARAIAIHRSRLDRLSDDQKFERRPNRVERMPINEFREVLCRRQNNRLDTFCHTAAKELVAFALRQRAASLSYDDSIKDYLPSFPWFKLAALVAEKCNAAGITFASGAVIEKPLDPLASTQDA